MTGHLCANRTVSNGSGLSEQVILYHFWPNRMFFGWNWQWSFNTG